MNLSSIKFKLLFGGSLLILLPLIASGFLSYSKSHDALLDISMQTAQGTAKDLARLTDKILSSELHLAASMASEKAFVDIVKSVNKKGAQEISEEIKETFNDIKGQFSKLDPHYQGIFLTGKDGVLFTGILDSGKEYKGSNISTRGYFKQAQQTKKAVISEMVLSKSTGKRIVVACAPILSSDNEFQGALGLVIRAEYFTTLISERKIGETGYGYMINKKGIIMAHPKDDFILKLDVTTIDAMKTINDRMIAGESGVERYTFKGTDKMAGFAPVSFNGWSICATQNEEEFLASSFQIRNFNLIFILAAAIIAITFITLLSKSILTPIAQAIDGLKDIAKGQGDLTKRLDVKTNDEIGELSHWFNQFIENLQKMILNISGTSETIRESSVVVQGLNTTVNDKLENISKSFGVVADSCTQTSDNMNSVSAAMEQATTSVDTVAAAAEEMSSSVDEIAKNTASARETTEETVAIAKNISTEVEKLSQATGEIDQVTSTITDISEQTNLLALNATIEAARAGDAGKGFAVVASEIKTLAQQTSDATLEIKSKIDSVQQATQTTVEKIAEVTKVIEESSQVVNSIASAVEEQSAATQEIALNASQTAAGIQEVNQKVAESSTTLDQVNQEIVTEQKAIEDVAFSTVEADINSTEMTEMSSSLEELAGRFHTGEKKFNIGKIKIAHLGWRTTLEAVIRGVKEMQPEEVVSHKDCELGKWYFGPGQELSNYEGFKEMDVWHEKVHSIAREVVALCAKGQQEKAAPLLDDFKEARVNLFKLLDAIYVK